MTSLAEHDRANAAAHALAAGDAMLPRPYRVVRTRRDTRDTVTLEL